MKINIMGFEQKAIIDAKLNGNDVIVLRTMVDMIDSERFTTKEIDGELYTWINYQLLVEDLPMISDKIDTFKKIVTKLVNNGFLDRQVKKAIGAGAYTYFKKTKKLDAITFKPEVKETTKEETKKETKKVSKEKVATQIPEDFIPAETSLRAELEIVNEVMTERISFTTSELVMEFISTSGISGLIPIVNRLSNKKIDGDFVNNKYVRNALKKAMNA
ncbi:MAG: hypothetical protein SOT71_12510 [Romboutsia timonensis]|uniref:hypothetical protein n=1 Tax=Romboutsia timonensis TaxID=1776391 RepID=UPI002A74BB98|nr:hypothetical protein [Romboutsia timonensis]MDY2883463.1 hypothetical protein [Romboutsia timonensis]